MSLNIGRRQDDSRSHQKITAFKEMKQLSDASTMMDDIMAKAKSLNALFLLDKGWRIVRECDALEAYGYAETAVATFGNTQTTSTVSTATIPKVLEPATPIGRKQAAAAQTAQSTITTTSTSTTSTSANLGGGGSGTFTDPLFKSSVLVPSTGMTPYPTRTVELKDQNARDQVKIFIENLHFKAKMASTNVMPIPLTQIHQLQASDAIADAKIAEAMRDVYVWIHVTGAWETQKQRDFRMQFYALLKRALKYFPQLYENVIDGDVLSLFYQINNAQQVSIVDTSIELQEKLYALNKTKSISFQQWYLQFTRLLNQLRQANMPYSPEQTRALLLKAMKHDNRYDNLLSDIIMTVPVMSIDDIYRKLEQYAKIINDHESPRKIPSDSEKTALVAEKVKKGGKKKQPTAEQLEALKKKACHRMARKGECKFGDKCYYSHKPKVLKKFLKKPDESNKAKNAVTDLVGKLKKEQQECASWDGNSGSCSYGAKCKFLHGGKPAAECYFAYVQMGSSANVVEDPMEVEEKIISQLFKGDESTFSVKTENFADDLYDDDVEYFEEASSHCGALEKAEVLEEKNFCQSGESIFSATHNSKEKVMIHSFYKICDLVDFHPYSENYWRIYAGWVTSQKCEAHIELSMVESDCVQELAGITWELNSESAGKSGQKFLGRNRDLNSGHGQKVFGPHRESNSVLVASCSSALPTELFSSEWCIEEVQDGLLEQCSWGGGYIDQTAEQSFDDSFMNEKTSQACSKQWRASDSSAKALSKTEQSKMYNPGIYAYAADASQTSQAMSSNSVLDSGCTQHMLPDQEQFRQYAISGTETECHYDILTAQGVMKSSFSASVCMSSQIDGKKGSINLRETLFVPGLSRPLTSLTSLLDDGYRVEMEGTECIIYQNQMPVLKVTRKKKGLFLIPTSAFAKGEDVVHANIAETYVGDQKVDIAHQRLAHLHKAQYVMPEYIKVKPGEQFQKLVKQFCAACAKTKLRRANFKGVRRHQAQHILHYIQMDTCGPFPTRDLHGNKYFTLFVDLKCNYNDLVPHKTKDELPLVTQSFVGRAERRHQPTKVVCLSSDGASNSKELLTWLYERGIEIIPTGRDSSKSNGKVERMHLTIQNAGNAMRHNGNGPPSLAMFSFVLAAMILNHLPVGAKAPVSKVNERQTPVEMWEKFSDAKWSSLLKPFRVFLCECWILIPEQRWRKGMLRTERGVWLGPHPQNRKLSVCLSLERSNTVITGRSVVTNETYLPFRKAMRMPSQIQLGSFGHEVVMPADTANASQGEEVTEGNVVMETVAPKPVVVNEETGKDVSSTESNHETVRKQLAHEYSEMDTGEAPIPFEIEVDFEGRESEKDDEPIARRTRSTRLDTIAEDAEDDREDLELAKIGRVFEQSQNPDWGPVKVVGVYKDDDYQVTYVRYPDDREKYSMHPSFLREEVIEAESHVATATTDEHEYSGKPNNSPERILHQMMECNAVLAKAFQWGMVYMQDSCTILPSAEFTVGEQLPPGGQLPANANAENFAFLASSAKPDLRGTAVSPIVGMTLAHDVDAALPRFHFQSHGHPLQKHIQEAEQREFQTLVNEGVFEMISEKEASAFRAKKGKVIDTLWVYKAKGDKKGFFAKVKARLALRGDQEKKTVSKADAYAPVMSQCTFKVLLSMHAADLSVNYYQGDVTAAFVSSKMKREVIVRLPYQFVEPGSRNDLYRLAKALYGGVDAGRCFYDDWLAFHKQMGFEPTHYDPCLVIKYRKDGSFIKCVFHVDDNCYASKGDEMWNWYKKEVCTRFKVNFGVLEHFLGIEVKRDPVTGAFTLSLDHAVRKMLEVFHVDQCKGKVDPPGSGVCPTKADIPTDPEEIKEAMKIPQQQAVGHLQYLQNTLFPELSYSVKIASKFNKSPCQAAWKWIKCIFKWLAAEQWDPYVIKGGDWKQLRVRAWSDADHAKDVDNRRSIGGSVIMLWDDLIDYGSFTQPIVSHSTPESELMALDLCVRRVQYALWIIEAMGGPVLKLVPVYCDCATTINWSGGSPFAPGRNCHLHARFFYVKDINGKVVQILKVDSALNLADLMVTFKDSRNFYTLCKMIKGGGTPAIRNGGEVDKKVAAKVTVAESDKKVAKAKKN